MHLQFAVASMLKLSRSSQELGDKPVTTEDLDRVLKGLAKFRELEGLTQPQPENPEEFLPRRPISSPPIAPLAASDSLFPLQNGFGIALLGEDVPGECTCCLFLGTHICMCTKSIMPTKKNNNDVKESPTCEVKHPRFSLATNQAKLNSAVEL